MAHQPRRCFWHKWQHHTTTISHSTAATVLCADCEKGSGTATTVLFRKIRPRHCSHIVVCGSDKQISATAATALVREMRPRHCSHRAVHSKVLLLMFHNCILATAQQPQRSFGTKGNTTAATEPYQHNSTQRCSHSAVAIVDRNKKHSGTATTVLFAETWPRHCSHSAVHH